MACKCYADYFFGNPRKDQICGTKKGGIIFPASDPECCPGGCPGQSECAEPKEPYGFGKFYDLRFFIRLSVVTISLALLILIYLKVLRPK